MRRLSTECIQVCIELYVNSNLEPQLAALKAKKTKKETMKQSTEANAEPKDKLKITLSLLAEHINDRKFLKVAYAVVSSTSTVLLRPNRSIIHH